MSKITHLTALTATDLEIIYGSLVTTKEIYISNFTHCKEAGNVSGMQQSQEVLKEVSKVIEKLEPRMELVTKELAEMELEKMRQNAYDPRREI